MNLASVWVPNSAEMDGFFFVPAAWQKKQVHVYASTLHGHAVNFVGSIHHACVWVGPAIVSLGFMYFGRAPCVPCPHVGSVYTQMDAFAALF